MHFYCYRGEKGKSATSNTTRQEKTTKTPSFSTYKLRKAKSLVSQYNCHAQKPSAAA